MLVGRINREAAKKVVGRKEVEKEEDLRMALCVAGQTWLPSWLPASATLPSPIPAPSALHPLHAPRNPFDPFPLSRSNAVAVLFFLPSHPLSGSFALIHRSPRPVPPALAILHVSRPIIVTRRRRTGKRERDGARGETFLYLDQRV